MLDETITVHMVRSEDTNPHGTLFAGQTAKWLVEAGQITAARLVGKPQDIVCICINTIVFKKPINNGDIIEIRSRVAYLGKTSITVSSKVFRKNDEAHLISFMATFVTIDKANKPYVHGLQLPEKYIAENRGIYDEALWVRTPSPF